MSASADLQAKFKNVDPFLLFKWERLFNKIFDSNASHSVDINDYYVLLRKVRDIYGAESDQMTYAKSSIKALWEGLIQLADKNKDSTVSVDEWVQLLSSYDPTKAGTWFSDYCVSMFKLFDVSGDKKLDMAEYADGMQTCGATESEANAAFRKFAVDAKGKSVATLDLTEFKKVWDQYFHSTDKEAPGNHLFGVLA